MSETDESCADPANDTDTTLVLVWTVAEAAARAKCSEASILRAIAATDPTKYPPPLHPIGRHGARGHYLITPAELQRWIESLALFI